MANNSKYHIIGITGGSGSGKTSFIRDLRKKFSSEVLCIISQDDYYFPREQQLVDAKGFSNFDLPESINSDRLIADLEQLLVDKNIAIKEYVFNNQLATPKDLLIKPAPVIIVEGLFVFHYADLAKYFDCRIFINAKENLKVIRRIKRDRVERNYPLEDVLYRYENHVLPSYEKYILPYKESADIIVNNNDDYSLGLKFLEAYIEDQVQKFAR